VTVARRRPLAALLTRRLAAIAAGVLLINLVVVAAYYARDVPALQQEAAEAEIARIERALLAGTPVDTRLYDRHPAAYGFAVLDSAGRMVVGANAELIPADALAAAMFADDWLTRLAGPAGTTIVASRAAEAASPPARVVFVAAGDPANLLARAVLGELVGHIWLPVLPGILLLLAANAVMVRRALVPVAKAAGWARAVRPGVATPPPPSDPMPAEIADLLDAAERSLDRLSTALEAEKRRAAEAAHALRTPLAVLIARVDALPRGETADHLRADLSALSRTVGQLLASANLDGLVVPEDTAVDLASVAEATVAALAPFAIARGVEIGVTRRDGLAPAIGDAGAVGLALRNLVENAVLHAGDGGRVEVAAGPGATLEVRDHGAGLPPGAAAAMYRPFWRGAGAPAGGAGLGLAIVERIQRAHGGTVEAANHPCGGAVFRLVFRPARPGRAPAGPGSGPAGLAGDFFRLVRLPSAMRPIASASPHDARGADMNGIDRAPERRAGRLRGEVRVPLWALGAAALILMVLVVVALD